MHGDYSVPAIRQLRDRLVNATPREKQIEHSDKAEKLLHQLKAQQTYNFRDVHRQITSSRAEAGPDLRIPGREVMHDLRLFVEDVSEAADIPAGAAGERVLTVEELAREFQVSTKTIARWRCQGLVSRRFVVGGRKRIGFLQSSVDRFVADNPQRVYRAARFSQMSQEERSTIIRRARALTKTGRWPADVIATLARETGRSAETIRYTLKQFDQRHPQDPVFPRGAGLPTEDVKQKIYSRYRLGASLESLGRRFRRSQSFIRRIVNEMRVRHVLELPLDYMPNDRFAEFASGSGEKEVLGPAPALNQPLNKPRVPKGLPRYLAAMYEVPLLTRQQEAHLFRKMNYLKYKAAKLRETLDPDRPKSRVMARIEQLHEQAVQVKNEILQSNLRLVVSIAKRHVQPTIGLFELISDGNMSLIRALEKFDFTRGNKFSTYASWAIMKNFARSVPQTHRHADRFRTGHDELFSSTEDDGSDPFDQESTQRRREAIVKEMFGRLDERERKILAHRFGLQTEAQPLTLKEIGAKMGVTKERIRQLEMRALGKLRQVAAEQKIEIP